MNEPTQSSDPDYRYEAEMGFTHSELLKGLPSAVVPYEVVKVDELVHEMHFDGRLVRLLLSPERARVIASISLPVTDVVLSFFNFDEMQYTAFMDRFKRYLHRGGG